MNDQTLAVFPSKQLAVSYGFFLLPSGATIPLNGGSVTARLARLLLDAYSIAPGLRLEVDVIARGVWPGHVVDAKSRTRVKVAVCRLRARGLPIVTMGGGYALDPRIGLELAAAAA